jgi:hypothetical protein
MIWHRSLAPLQKYASTLYERIDTFTLSFPALPPMIKYIDEIEKSSGGVAGVFESYFESTTSTSTHAYPAVVGAIRFLANSWSLKSYLYFTQNRDRFDRVYEGWMVNCAVLRYGIVHEFDNMIDRMNLMTHNMCERHDPKALAYSASEHMLFQMMWLSSLSAAAHKPACYDRFDSYGMKDWESEDFLTVMSSSGTNKLLFYNQLEHPALCIRLMYWGYRATPPDLTDLSFIPSIEVLESYTKTQAPMLRVTFISMLTLSAVCFERAGADDRALELAQLSRKLDYYPYTLMQSGIVEGNVWARKGEMHKALTSFNRVVEESKSNGFFMMGVTAMVAAVNCSAIGDAESQTIIDELCKKMGTKRADYDYMLAPQTSSAEEDTYL